MRVLISTPLFPPEVAYPAKFSKEFAEQLGIKGHTVTVATFSNFPEIIKNVKVVHVNKNKNIFSRMFSFLFVMIKNVGKNELVVLKQAGFSSFLTILVAKIFRVKVILKMREDEAYVRVQRQGVNPKGITIWRVKFLQKIIFKLSHMILFDSLSLRDSMCKEYKISKEKTFVLPHPTESEVFPFGDFQTEREKKILEWKQYVENFEKQIYGKF